MIVVYRDESGEEVTLLDALLWTASFCLYAGYMLFMFIKYQNNPSSIHLGMNLNARRQWMRFVMCTPSQEIMALQAMRNSIMEATFLGTISSTIGFYILSLALASYNLHKGILATKYVLLSVTMFSAFITFAFAIRNYNHVGFLASVKSSPKEIDALLDKYNQVSKKHRKLSVEAADYEMDDFDLPIVPPAEIKKLLSENVDPYRVSLIPNATRLLCGGVVSHFFGLRLFYFSILIGLSIIAAPAVIIGAALLVVGIASMDHVFDL